MSINKALEKLMRLEERMNKLPPLSSREASNFDKNNMINSVFYSNLLEGNTLSREEAIKAMFKRNNGSND